MNKPTIRKARLGHFFDGTTRINVRVEAGKLAFNKHKSRKVTYATVPWLELYHASVGQLSLEGMAQAWGLKPQTPQPPTPTVAEIKPAIDHVLLPPVQPQLIEEGITP